MVITEECVNLSQLDDLSTRLFKVKGKIHLDKNDLAYVLGGDDDSKLITFQREDEESKEFMTKLTSHLASKPDIKKLKRIMLNFGYSPEHPLRMEDITSTAKVIWSRMLLLQSGGTSTPLMRMVFLLTNV